MQKLITHLSLENLYDIHDALFCAHKYYNKEGLFEIAKDYRDLFYMFSELLDEVNALNEKQNITHISTKVLELKYSYKKQKKSEF